MCSLPMLRANNAQNTKCIVREPTALEWAHSGDRLTVRDRRGLDRDLWLLVIMGAVA